MDAVRSQGRRIAVVGGGVVGLTSALVLSYDHNVTVVADRVGVLSDSSKATAIWHVYLVPETDEILLWAQRSLEKFYDLATHDSLAGIELVQGVELFRKGLPQVPTWSHIPKLFGMLSHEEIASFNKLSSSNLTKTELSLLKANPVTWGYRIEAPAADMRMYLSWLEKNVIRRGVRIEQKRLTSFEDLSSEYDIIVNCAGFGARELAKDRDFVAYKGQYFVLKGSNVTPKTYIGDDDHPGGMAYMIPRLGEVMVGGCAEKDREDLELTLQWDDTIKRAGLYIPWLQNCSPADQARPPVVCIRPSRNKGIRLDVDLVSASVPIVHNYGHGGSGFSLSWGCAEAVRTLIAN
jgi:glycine/D-amino acid oxidase-like deaminating enzyme